MQLYSLCLGVRGGQSLSLARGCAGSQVRAISMAMCSASADKEEVEYAVSFYPKFTQDVRTCMLMYIVPT